VRAYLVVIALLAAACGGYKKSVEGPPSGELATPAPDCLTTCHRAAECDVGAASACETECRAAAADDDRGAYWACVASSADCAEMDECARAADAAP
jgi:hypothetical protein